MMNEVNIMLKKSDGWRGGGGQGILIIIINGR